MPDAVTKHLKHLEYLESVARTQRDALRKTNREIWQLRDAIVEVLRSERKTA